MKIKSPLTLLIMCLMLVVSISLNAQERLISKALKEIDENDFENAGIKLKEVKSKSGNSPFYLFVMYKFYAIKSNHKYNVDSAHYYLLKTEEALSLFNEKKSLEYCKQYQLCSEYFNEMKNTLAKDAYYVFAKLNSIESLNEYKIKYFSYPFLNLADEKIDTLLYNQAENQNTIDAFEFYLKKTSQNIFKSIAELKIEELAYNKTTEINTVEAFKDYLAKYPKAHNLNETWEKLHNIAWTETSKLNKEKNYLEYFINYPNSYFATESKQKYLKSAVLVPFKKLNENWVYVDKETLIPIITEEFDYADFFIGDYAKVAKNTSKANEWLFGIINKKGEIVVPIQYGSIEIYDDGNAILENFDLILQETSIKTDTRKVYEQKNTKYFFFNSKTEDIIKISGYIIGYSEGIICVRDESLLSEEGQYYFVDESGMKLYGRNFQYASKFGLQSTGLAEVMKENISTWEGKNNSGYINKKGELQIPYIVYGGFLDEIGVVADLHIDKQGYARDKWVLKDLNGKEITAPIFDNINKFSNGLSLVKIKEKYGFINKYGKIIIPIIYDFVRDFSEKHAVFGKFDKNQKLKYGVIDILGNISIEPKYDEIMDFSEALAGYKKGEKWGFLNSSGKEVIQSKYDEVNDFNEGLAAVKLNGYWGFIDKDGNQKIACKYSLKNYDTYRIRFENGFFLVDFTSSGSYHVNHGSYIDKSGREFWDNSFYKLENYTTINTPKINKYFKINQLSNKHVLGQLEYATSKGYSFKGTANFASFYEILIYGVGTGCEQAVMIDLRDGKVYGVPIDCPSCISEDEKDEYIDFKVSSQLIINTICSDHKEQIFHYWSEGKKEFTSTKKTIKL